MNEQQTRYMHIRRPMIKFTRTELINTCSSTGGITVAYKKIGDNQYKCAMARCNLKDKDHYRKSEGRSRALQRLIEDDDVWTLDLAEGADIYSEMLELLLTLKEFRRALRPEVR